MIEIDSFYNDGTGWVCRACERDLVRSSVTGDNRSRVFREGEAECKIPELAHEALAKWTDKTRQALTCPRCGLTEIVDKR